MKVQYNRMAQAILYSFSVRKNHGKPLYDEIVEKANDGSFRIFCLWRNRDK